MRPDLVLVFFVYGLAFFSMGIALTLEMGRSPILVERREFVPLALFGLLHGAHEWMEIVILQGVWLNAPFPPQVSTLRVALLIVSFLCLLAFAIISLQSQGRLSFLFNSLAAIWLLSFILIAFQISRAHAGQAIAINDALSRYMLAVPSSLLTAWALQSRAHQVQAGHRPALQRYFRWAALGFGLYGLTQVFVSPIDLLPARYLNADLFIQVTGIPIQLLRALIAVLVTWNMLRAIQMIEREREQRLFTAQQDRLTALEQLHRAISQSDDQRRRLLRHIVIAQEDERARIAHELHDETAQILTAFSLNLATLQGQITRNNQVRGLIEILQALSQQMSQSLYHIVRDLRPPQLDDLGLVPALHFLIDDEFKRLSLQVTLQIRGVQQRLDPLVETVIFRVAQEALTNVSRHARTRQASLELGYEAGLVRLRVSDSGAGFDPQADLSPPRGWGLAGMRERVAAIGGQFNLQSAPGSGTLVEAVVPLAEPDAAAPVPIDAADSAERVLFY
jgi:signal transduction histidine kinase